MYYRSSTRQTPLRCLSCVTSCGFTTVTLFTDSQSVSPVDCSSTPPDIRLLLTTWYSDCIQITVFCSLVRKGQQLPSSTPKMEKPVSSETLVYQLLVVASQNTVLWTSTIHRRGNSGSDSGTGQPGSCPGRQPIRGAKTSLE
jgi:hypothetical protein